MLGSCSAGASANGSACARTMTFRSSSSRFTRSTWPAEPQAMAVVTRISRQRSSRWTSGVSAPSSPWWLRMACAQIAGRPEGERHRSRRTRRRATARRPRAPGTARAPRAASRPEAKCASGGSARSFRGLRLGPHLVDLAPELLRGALDAERIVHVDQRLAAPSAAGSRAPWPARPGRSPGAAPPSRRRGCPRGSGRASRGAGWWGCRCARRRRARRPRRRAGLRR